METPSQQQQQRNQPPQELLRRLTPPERQWPDVQVNGADPFYLCKMARVLFDQSDLPPAERFFPLMRFQDTALMLAAMYRFIKITAPSQSGKTSIAELIAALSAFAYAGQNVLILSTKEDQAARLLRDIKNKLIERTRVPELRLLSKDTTTELELAVNRSKIIALPHSIKALTGTPAGLVILDEVGKFDKDPEVIEAEAIARLGRTHGQLLEISTFFGEGVPDSLSPKGYRGSYYHYAFQREFANRSDPDKHSVAANFTLRVNPWLNNQEPALREEMKKMGPGFFEEHYLGIARKAAGVGCFANQFNRKAHVKSDAEIAPLLNPNIELCLSFDPGLRAGAVLLQIDLDIPRVIALRSWISDGKTVFEQWVRSVWMKVRKEFGRYDVLTFCDVAGNQQNRQTYETDIEVISRITGQYPISIYQKTAPGVQIIKSFLKLTDGFITSENNVLLNEGLEGGCKERMVNNIPQGEYEKDGYYEHIMDPFRYAVFIQTGGFTPMGAQSAVAYEANAYNPFDYTH